MAASNSLAVSVAQGEVCDALSKLSKLFDPACKLAFVMWRPGMPECFMVVGDDPLEGAAEAIQKSIAQAERQGEGG